MPRRKRPLPPFVEHVSVQDAFASGFQVQDWEDWVRVVAWADDIEEPVDGSAARAVRRMAASLVVPRSALPSLIRALGDSMGHRPQPPRRHS